MMGCRTKEKAVSKEKEKIEIKQISDIDSTVTVKAEAVQVIEEKKQETKVEKSQEGHVEIKGKTDSANAFNYTNVVGGDTLSISITGNADFVIKNKFSDRVKETVSESLSENLNAIAEFSRKVVAQETIKEVASEIKKTDVAVKTKNFTFGAWFTWVLTAIIVICAVWLFYYLRQFIKR